MCRFFLRWSERGKFDYRTQSIWVIGGLLILFGVLELAGIGFSLLPERFGRTRMDGSWASAYMTGVVYGFAGFCSGPLLGAVLTMAAGAGHPLYGSVLLFVYATGMAFPLFLLAVLWDRFDLVSRSWLRGTSIRIGPVRVHTTNLITGGLFILLGGLFLTSGGTIACERFYESLGLLQFSMDVQHKLSSWSTSIPNLLWIAAMVLAAWLGLRFGRSRRKPPQPPA